MIIIRKKNNENKIPGILSRKVDLFTHTAAILN